MATEPDPTTAEVVPAPQTDSMVGIDDAAPNNDILNAYSVEGQKQTGESSHGTDHSVDIPFGSNGVDDHDESESSLSSPPSSSDEEDLEITLLPQPSTQDATSNPSVSQPGSVKAASDPEDADADAATTLSANPNHPQAVSPSSGFPSTQTQDNSPDATIANAPGIPAPVSSLTEGATTIPSQPSIPASAVSETQPLPADGAQESTAGGASASLASDGSAETDASEPGIDIDKMLDAISADAPPGPSSSALPPAAGILRPFNPPSGPSRTNNGSATYDAAASLSAESPVNFVYDTVGAPGTVGNMTVLGSPPSSATSLGAGSQILGAAAPGTLPKLPPAPRRGNNQKEQQKEHQKEKAAVDRAYQEFLQEERRYMSDANWEKFPDGSRMFIGNLSQERVSKRDVFEAFYRYGRLAQISIKSAYGFVQYHTAAEAQNAMQNLQGSEIRGRKIHLELSKTQKKEKDRERSPGRKSRGGRGSDRYDGRERGGRRGRDDYRPGAGDASPRRKDDHYSGRDRNSRDNYNGRDRSRSPNRSDSKSYRSRRSPSPHRRGRNDNSSGHGFDGMRGRTGSDVPDVQFLVTQGLERDFIKWVQNAFIERGMKTDIMLITPHSPPRNTIIQTQVLEGVTAVVDLDTNSQNSGKISLQVFDRSAGTSNVRFNGYQDLSPPIAADVVMRARATAVSQRASYPAAANSYGQQQYPVTAPGVQSYGPNYQAAAPTAAPTQPSAYDLASLMGQLDSSTLSQLLGTLQGSQAAAPAAPAVPSTLHYGQSAAPQMDLGAILSTLGATASTPSLPNYGAPAPYSASVPRAPAASYPAVQQGGNDQAIQAIMAQLAKYK